jgi:flagellin FlaB
MTGLETAIILIAFVTVASVLAYSVLSAGIFSAEKGKSTVYSGLAQAQGTLELRGLVLGNGDSSNATLTSIEFTVGLVVPGMKVDKDAFIFNYWDTDNTDYAITETSFALASGSAERGIADVIEGDEVFRIELPLDSRPASSARFSVQVVPPTGATLTIEKTLPAKMYSRNILD